VLAWNLQTVKQTKNPLRKLNQSITNNNEKTQNPLKIEFFFYINNKKGGKMRNLV